ncbi:ThiF family adenylyltransferase [Streptomyces cellulosae]|uniref:ThiF family adenylyltransferase n=1 Tax=Streptomyces sp. Akac8 TaxID=2563106 RepID=UPI00109E554C|nr:ThiF family adenylyltransferase [Streptomyces sp. Akac8]WSB91017.1 ThiF family adenylyltransferase [Streptomyces cellulosae]
MAAQPMTGPWTLRMSADMAATLRKHLFPGDGDEHGAVIGASVVTTPRGTRLLARRLYLAQDGVDYVPGQRGYRMLTATFVRDRVRECRSQGLAYLAVHCHGGTTRVGFSATDLASHERGYPALRDILGSAPVGGLVFATDAVAGDLWLPGGGRAELDQAVITGWPINTLRPKPVLPPTSDPAYDRQSRVFGDRGQATLAEQEVGVIGAGGAGSLIIEYLARLGIGELLIVDPDRVERTNLPRLVGAHTRDAHTWMTHPARPRFVQALGQRLATPKVKVARRVARQANPGIRVHALQADVTKDEIATSLVDCDYLFLAADSMQARLVFNALVNQYLIPGVQVGAKVQVGPEGAVTDVFSVVRPVAPGFGCLWCNELISPAKLQEEALTPEQRRQQRYVQDESIHAPSVISLNAVAAAHAVDDYLHTVTGLLPTTYEPRWRRFHPMSPAAPQRVRCDVPRTSAECTECSGTGVMSLVVV